MTDDWSMDDAVAYGEGLLRGERVRLRPVEPADHEEIVRWWRNAGTGAIATTQYLPRSVLGTIEKVERLSSNAPGGYVGFAVETLDGKLIGHVSLSPLEMPARITELGIGLAPEVLGEGYGSDVLRVMVNYAFAELGAHKVELTVHAFNTRGVRSYEKVGFVVEGRRRASIIRDGRFYDELQMGVLAEEWFAARSSTTDG